MQYANSHLPDSAKILCVFLGWRGYYLEREHIFDHQNNSEWLISWLKEPDVTANMILQRLKENGISHVLIRKDLFNRWIQSAYLSKQTIEDILAQNYLTSIAEHQNYTLFRVNVNKY
jgi:hypothetical protein